jgi:branched-chain amino acid transport system ATP-binding protein
MPPLLRLDSVQAGYGAARVLHGISLDVNAGEVVCLLGGNGAGKSTTLLTILGLLRPTHGRIEFQGRPIAGLDTAEIVRRGLAVVPEGRRIFGPLTVEENLLVGAAAGSGRPVRARIVQLALDLFPDLAGRMQQAAGTLSGGQQQMVAIARALASGPKLLLMDEPSMGLSPVMAEKVFQIIERIRTQGVAVLLVEQNAHATLAVASRGYVLQSGEIAVAGTAETLRASEQVQEAYL